MLGQQPQIQQDQLGDNIERPGLEGRQVGYIFYLAGGQNPVVTEMTSSGDAWQSGGNTPTSAGDIWKATTIPVAYSLTNVGTQVHQNNHVNTWRQQP